MSRLIKIDREQMKEEAVAAAVNALRDGAMIIYPTETIYGLGVDCTQQEAIKKLYRVKKRARSKPVALIAADRAMVMRYVVEVSEDAHRLMEEFWPGALTLVFNADECVGRLLTGGTGTIGIRVPGDALCRMLAKGLGRPITATSANIAGEKESRSLDQIPYEITSSADFILDGGTTPGTAPSTVISVASDRLEVLRDGAVPRNVLERFLGSRFK